MDTQRQRFIAAAKRYAAADRSDPFAYNRAMTQIDNGIACSLRDGADAIYDAVESHETRALPAGTTFSDGTSQWSVPVYRNMTRP